MERKDSPDKSLMTKDADGTTAKVPLSVKGTPILSGARIGKNFKTVGVVVAGMVMAGIVVGVMTAGKHKSNDAETGTESTGQNVGQTKPPIDEMQKIAAEKQAALGGSGDAPPRTPAPVNPDKSNTFPPNSKGADIPKQGEVQKLTPEQEYRKWLVEQRYKNQEGAILSAQSAKLAKISAADTLQTASNAQPQRVGAAIPPPYPPFGQPQNPQTQPPKTPDQAFLDAQNKGDSGYLESVAQPAASKHELFAGSVIPATMLTGIESDLPGAITAEVRQTVYDSLNPDVVLIPQGTRIVGKYSSDVAYGQKRVLVAWNQLIYPNGSMINIKGMQGTDEQGQSGFYDQVDNHYMKIFGSAIMMSLLGVAAQLSQPQNTNALTTPTYAQMGSAAMAQQLDTAGTNLLNKNLNIQPTLTIRPGYAFDVLVNKTMILPPYVN